MVIDADAHVLESERTWDYLEPADRKYRPVPVTVPADPSIGRARRDAWVIDGKIRGLRFPTLTEEELAALSAKLGRDVCTQQESREMGDVDLRIRHMDTLGIDVQVLHNTIFIESVSDRPEVEVALCRAWNRWMAEVWRLGQGRLRWVCVPPFQSIPDALDAIRFGKAQGAVGMQLPPFAGHRLMTDPYFRTPISIPSLRRPSAWISLLRPTLPTPPPGWWTSFGPCTRGTAPSARPSPSF